MTYFKVFDALSHVVKPGRIGGLRREIEQVDGAFKITWSDGTIFYFAHPNNYGRYAWPEGLDYGSRFLLDKYQDGNVRILNGDIVVESGCNVGEFTCAAAKIAQSVYGFDPDANVQSALRRNVSTFSNIETYEQGLGEKAGQTVFYISTRDADSSVIRPKTFTKTVTIDVTTIEDFMRLKNLPKIDFFKVEAEGFEPEILKGCGSRLRDISRIAIDCSPERDGKSPFEECEAILQPAGFKTWRRQAKNDFPPMLFAILQR
jgi:FkbM family methyltransferase